VDDLGVEIAALIGDDGRREAMSSAAIEHARGLSWTAVAARHLDLLADAVARR
jgi:glycosyltransferase involved in cell wall biosynthesis